MIKVYCAGSVREGTHKSTATIYHYSAFMRIFQYLYFLLKKTSPPPPPRKHFRINRAGHAIGSLASKPRQHSARTGPVPVGAGPVRDDLVGQVGSIALIQGLYGNAPGRRVAQIRYALVLFSPHVLEPSLCITGRAGWPVPPLARNRSPIDMPPG